MHTVYPDFGKAVGSLPQHCPGEAVPVADRYTYCWVKNRRAEPRQWCWMAKNGNAFPVPAGEQHGPHRRAPGAAASPASCARRWPLNHREEPLSRRVAVSERAAEAARAALPRQLPRPAPARRHPGGGAEEGRGRISRLRSARGPAACVLLCGGGKMAAHGGSAASAALKGLIQQFTAITGEAHGRPGPAQLPAASRFVERSGWRRRAGRGEAGARRGGGPGLSAGRRRDGGLVAEPASGKRGSGEAGSSPRGPDSGPPAGSPLGVAHFGPASRGARASRDGAERRPLEVAVRSIGASAPRSAAGFGPDTARFGPRAGTAPANGSAGELRGLRSSDRNQLE